MSENCDIKNIYMKIFNDKNIHSRYKEIEIYEKNNNGLAFHNFEHIKNVTNIVEQILKDLNLDEEFIYKAKIACLLHDVGANTGKSEHAYRSYQYAFNYFIENNINFSDKDLVLEAIKIHSDGFETSNVLALSLILADKLDIKKSRISEEGKKVIGNRQYTHINDIFLKIKEKKLSINFITDGNIDIEELNNYYFTKKVFKAIESFSSKLNLDYFILLDNNEWNLN